jgi:hypothetical protein
MDYGESMTPRWKGFSPDPAVAYPENADQLRAHHEYLSLAYAISVKHACLTCRKKGRSLYDVDFSESCVHGHCWLWQGGPVLNGFWHHCCRNDSTKRSYRVGSWICAECMLELDPEALIQK